MREYLRIGAVAMLLESSAMAADGIDDKNLMNLDQIVKTWHSDLVASFYCVGKFTQRGTDEYAIAATQIGNAKLGSYFIYAKDGVLTKLSDFNGGMDLQCMTNEHAKKLNPIFQPSGMHGHIPDSHPYGTVCGFVDATTSTCWGYDEKKNIFTVVGGWIT